MKRINILYLCISLLIACSAVSCSSDDNPIANAEATVSVESFSPVSGLPGSLVTVQGSNFGTAGRVFFNESEATEYVSRADNQIQVKVPSNAASGQLCVINGQEYGFSKDSFIYIQSASITGLSSDYGRSGDELTISGANFHDIDVSQVKVLFGEVQAEILSYDAQSIVVTIPNGLPDGYVNISVTFGTPSDAYYQTVLAPQFRIGDKLADPYTKVFDHHDVVEVTGKANPCSYAATDYTSTICERDKSDYTTYVPQYKSGYDESSTVMSFAVWDVEPGNSITFKVDIPETSDFYVYFGSRGKTAGNISVACGSDKENLGEGMTLSCKPTGASSWGDVYHNEFGTFHLKAGVNYVKVTISNDQCINGIRITNQRQQ